LPAAVHETYEVKDKFKVNQSGEQVLTVRTTEIYMNNARIEGVGNEPHLSARELDRNEFTQERACDKIYQIIETLE